jgi:hypothetical protein
MEQMYLARPEGRNQTLINPLSHGGHGDISEEARRPGIGEIQSLITHAFLDSLEIICSVPLRFCGKNPVRKTSFHGFALQI